ncbi:MAG: NAD-dependent epimerase/dehydratase family protein [bacterium]|nr:NAD-dependent epimerase/dehydratase family protein [bacterium]
MNILLTGGSGFIGSHIADLYIKNQHKLIIIDNLSSGNIGNLKGIDKKAKFIKLDIKRKRDLFSALRSYRIDVINHHAAQIDVRVSEENTLKDIKENIIGSLNIIELANLKKVKHIIFAGSAGTVYGEVKNKKIPDEQSTPEPISIYGINKLTAEYYIKSNSYWNKKITYCILRYGNVYGPRQDPNGEAGVVAIFIGRILKNKHIYIYGSGKQLRDFVYVEDVAKANVLALNKKGVYNIGTGKAHSVLDIVDILERVHGRKIIRVFKPARKGEIFKSAFKVEKAANELGWRAKVSLYDGIKKTYEWFKSKST